MKHVKLYEQFYNAGEIKININFDLDPGTNKEKVEAEMYKLAQNNGIKLVGFSIKGQFRKSFFGNQFPEVMALLSVQGNRDNISKFIKNLEHCDSADPQGGSVIHDKF